jgi:peptide-methionine (S)-S-oxide reductase
MDMKEAILALLLMIIASAVALAVLGGEPRAQQDPVQDRPDSPGGEVLVIAGGCFWCLEPLFEMIKGVEDVEVGYAGGRPAGVTYQQVMTGKTGHAEAVKIAFDPKVVSADDLLRIFFTIHDPTTLNRQGPDSGPQYRSAVFYASPEEKARAERIMKEIADEGIWPNPLVTTIEPLQNYTRAEEYHQDYYRKFEQASAIERARMNSGYCRVVIEPKVRQFRDKFKHLMRGQ